MTKFTFYLFGPTDIVSVGKKDSANLSLMFSGIKQIYKTADDIRASIYFYDYEMICVQLILNDKKTVLTCCNVLNNMQPQ